MMRWLLLVCLLLVPSTAYAGDWRPDADGTKDMGWWEGDRFIGRYFAAEHVYREYDHEAKKYGAAKKRWPEPVGNAGKIDYLGEVNRQRAMRGQRPFTYDPGLEAAAEAAAQFRAARGIQGHVMGGMGDFQFLPPGVHATAAGCAGNEASWGFMACCTDGNYTFAGCAAVMGHGGRLFCHIFVR